MEKTLPPSLTAVFDNNLPSHLPGFSELLKDSQSE
jgi:hypothetical protein